MLQLERRGYFYVDKPHIGPNSPLTLHFVPDGKSTNPFKINTAVIDAVTRTKGAGGTGVANKAEQKKLEQAKDAAAGEEVKKSKKDLKKEAKKAAKKEGKSDAHTGGKPEERKEGGKKGQPTL